MSSTGVRRTVTPIERKVAVGFVVAMAAWLSFQVAVAPAARAASPLMFQDQAYRVGGATEDKPQSKLWFNDGAWWALMRTNANGVDGNPDVTIHKLQPDHTWFNTGTVVDQRAASTGDALWEGGKLYVSSRVANGDVQVTRLSYNTTTHTYSMASGFPKVVANGSIESVTIARDSQKRLWVTFTRPYPSDTTLDQVWVAHSAPGNDFTW